VWGAVFLERIEEATRDSGLIRYAAAERSDFKDTGSAETKLPSRVIVQPG